jgi:hypothetical protein
MINKKSSFASFFSRSIAGLVPSKDVHCLIEWEKKILPSEISRFFLFPGLERPNTHQCPIHKSRFRV